MSNSIQWSLWSPRETGNETNLYGVAYPSCCTWFKFSSASSSFSFSLMSLSGERLRACDFLLTARARKYIDFRIYIARLGWLAHKNKNSKNLNECVQYSNIQFNFELELHNKQAVLIQQYPNWCMCVIGQCIRPEGCGTSPRQTQHPPQAPPLCAGSGCTLPVAQTCRVPRS